MPTKKQIDQAVKASNLPSIYRAYYQKLLVAMPDTLIEYFQRAFGVDFWKTKPLSCGTHGCAWEIGHGKIIKITQDATDAQVAIQLKELNHFNDVIPRIVCVFQSGSVFGIVMERVTPLEKSRYDFVSIDETLEKLLEGGSSETEGDEILAHKLQRLEAEEIFSRKLQRLADIQKATGFDLTWDCFAGNWGLRDPEDLETAVLFDLGLHSHAQPVKQVVIPQLSL